MQQPLRFLYKLNINLLRRMKILTSRFSSHTGKLALLSVLLSAGFVSQAFAYTPLSSTLDFGAKGTNVTNLQVFFADNASIYPEGLVTGYFGALTRAAVQRFQAAYGIVSSGSAATTGYGRVGPTTLAKINSLVLAGGWTTADATGPAFYNVVQTQTSSYGVISFNTNEATNARVVYSTSPVQFSEGDISSNGFGALTGSTVSSTSGLNTSHSMTIPNLQSNTTYYYTVIATDAAGNASVIGPNNTFRTGM
jgi:peptidoglycan hydrolase-like protein with peptidoglycan-binding domain